MATAIPQIERATGLAFKTAPTLEVRSRDQLREFLIRKFNEATPAEQLRGEEVAYKLLGLIPDTMDLRAFLLELLAEQIVGYYDPGTKVLYVVEGASEELAGMTLIHELIHALQDQYLNLDSIQNLKGNSDRIAAAQAVLEGHATYETLAIILGTANLAARIGGWDQMRDMIREEQSAMPIFAGAPMVIQESLLFPYLSGAEFVRRYYQHRPKSTLLDSMPVSTEQVIHERAFFRSADMPVNVILPPPADRGAHEETLGEFGTRLFLFQHLKNQNVASGAAAGWDGDRYRVVRGNSIVWISVWDSAVDAAQFVDALGQSIVRRYRSEAPSIGANGVRTYTGSGRTVVITPREIDGRNAVMYVDVPAGAPVNLLDITRVTLRD